MNTLFWATLYIMAISGDNTNNDTNLNLYITVAQLLKYTGTCATETKHAIIIIIWKKCCLHALENQQHRQNTNNLKSIVQHLSVNKIKIN